MKLGIISDIHEDIESLRKTIKQLEKEGVKEIACLGDITGFSIPTFPYLETRNANECLDIIKSNCTIVVPGNHDLYAAGRIPEFANGFEYSENWYDLPFDERDNLAKGRVWLYEDHDLSPMLNRKNKAYLQSLNEYNFSDIDNIPILFSHYIYPNLSGSTTGFISSNNELKEHYDFLKSKGCRFGISGHRHVEGALIASKMKMHEIQFGLHQLSEDFLWINGPAIARSNRKSGYMIFNTETFVLEVKQI